MGESESGVGEEVDEVLPVVVAHAGTHPGTVV